MSDEKDPVKTVPTEAVAAEAVAAEAERPEGRYSVLPDHVRLEDTIPTKEASPVPDPEMGRNPDRDFMLRNAAG